MSDESPLKPVKATMLSKCPLCDRWIKPGMWLWLDTVTRKWVHYGCWKKLRSKAPLWERQSRDIQASSTPPRSADEVSAVLDEARRARGD